MLLVSLMNYFSFFNLGIELRKSRLTEVTILFNASKLISNQKACFLFVFVFFFKYVWLNERFPCTNPSLPAIQSFFYNNPMDRHFSPSNSPALQFPRLLPEIWAQQLLAGWFPHCYSNPWIPKCRDIRLYPKASCWQWTVLFTLYGDGIMRALYNIKQILSLIVMWIRCVRFRRRPHFSNNTR